MAKFRITCTRQIAVKEPTAKSHIVAVGTGPSAEQHDALWTIDEVLLAMEKGSQFYTQGEVSGRVALVEKHVCPHCGRTLIRSASNAVSDNNLESLPQVPAGQRTG